MGTWAGESNVAVGGLSRLAGSTEGRPRVGYCFPHFLRSRSDPEQCVRFISRVLRAAGGQVCPQRDRNSKLAGRELEHSPCQCAGNCDEPSSFWLSAEARRLSDAGAHSSACIHLLRSSAARNMPLRRHAPSSYVGSSAEHVPVQRYAASMKNAATAAARDAKSSPPAAPGHHPARLEDAFESCRVS